MRSPEIPIVQEPRRNTSLPTEISREIREGRALAGDDFSDEQLSVWFAQEREAFYSQDCGNSIRDPWYAYMRYVNESLGFSKVEAETRDAGSILVLGPGSGLEIERFSRRNPGWSIYFLEASENFRIELKRKWPDSTIVDPQISGDILLDSGSQDIVCAFSVLHHIPNVSKVVRESFRVVRPGGHFLVREPCSSMGDWRCARSATPNERGISRSLLMTIAANAGFRVMSKPVPILLEPINRIVRKTIGYSMLPFSVLYALDRSLSFIFSANDHYWRDKWYKKIGPSSYFYVFQKPPMA